MPTRGMTTTNLSLIAAHLDWLALFIGTIGTVLWAHNGRWAKYAAVYWLASSVVWMAFAWLQGLPALGVRDAISTALYVYGGWRWLRKPQKSPQETAN